MSIEAETLRTAAMQACTDWMKPGVMELRAGEMTAQEKRTAKAVLVALRSEIEALPIAPQPPQAGRVDEEKVERACKAYAQSVAKQTGKELVFTSPAAMTEALTAALHKEG